MIFTVISNTAVHDNQFASKYPIQLQSRLRKLWLNIGSDGAGINIRNVAVGAPKTETMAWHLHTRSSETVSYPFNNIETIGLKRNEDIIFWESFMNAGGRPPGIATEQQLRLTALLNAIWGDYIIYNYNVMTNKTTFGTDMINDIDIDRIPDIKS
eukprot:264898_1